MKKTLLCSLAMALAVSAALPGAAATTKGPAAGKTVKIGVIADVTGSAAVYGTMQKNAYDLATEDIKTRHHRRRRRQPLVRRRRRGERRRASRQPDAKIHDRRQHAARTRSHALGRSVQGVSDREGREFPGDGHLDDRRRRHGDRPDHLPRLARRIASDPADRRKSASRSGMRKRSPSSTATTTRSPRPTATSSSASSRRAARPWSTPRRSTSAIKTSAPR